MLKRKALFPHRNDLACIANKKPATKRIAAGFLL